MSYIYIYIYIYDISNLRVKLQKFCLLPLEVKWEKYRLLLYLVGTVNRHKLSST